MINNLFLVPILSLAVTEDAYKQSSLVVKEFELGIHRALYNL